MAFRFNASSNVSNKNTTAAGTNLANQTVLHGFPYVKQADVVVTSITSGGAKTVLVLGTDYTIADVGSGRVKTSGTITLINALPTTSTVTITHKYPADQSGDITRMANEEGNPIDGELAQDDRGISSIQTAKKRSFTLKACATASNP